MVQQNKKEKEKRSEEKKSNLSHLTQIAQLILIVHCRFKGCDRIPMV
jgi:hypothetical protein